MRTPYFLVHHDTHTLPVRSFVDSRNNGLDGVIPRSVLQNAKGFAIFTVAKAGFLFSARAGSGVVVAKMNDGSESKSDRSLGPSLTAVFSVVGS